jgi:hypothetical protein
MHLYDKVLSGGKAPAYNRSESAGFVFWYYPSDSSALPPFISPARGLQRPARHAGLVRHFSEFRKTISMANQKNRLTATKPLYRSVRIIYNLGSYYSARPDEHRTVVLFSVPPLWTEMSAPEARLQGRLADLRDPQQPTGTPTGAHWSPLSPPHNGPMDRWKHATATR